MNRTPPASAKRSSALAGPSVTDLQDELQYTQDVLKRYKTYVDEKLQRQLDQYAITCDELGVECSRLRDENVLLHNRLESAQAAIEKHFADSREEVETKEVEIRTIKRELEKLHELDAERQQALNASQRGSDEELAAMQTALAKRDQEIHKLRLVLAERNASVSAQPAASPTYSSPLQKVSQSWSAQVGASICSSIQTILSDALDFSNTFAAACSHISIDCGGSVASWKALQQKPLVPESLADILAELAAVERTQHAAIAQALKAFVLRQAEILDTVTTKEHEHHAEKELMKRRLDEIERDRRSEREAASLRAEKERLRSTMAGGPTFQRAAWGSSTVDELVLGVGSQATRVESVATQTVFAENAAGTGSADASSERLLAEVRRLQDESAVHKSTILLLEQQRKTFLGFVDNDRISAHVKSALSGSLTDAVRHAAGLSF